MKSFSLKELGQLLGAEVRGDDSVTVSSVATLEKARPDQITFLANTKYRSQLEQTQAGAVLISPKELDGFAGNALVLNDPYVALPELRNCWTARRLQQRISIPRRKFIPVPNWVRALRWGPMRSSGPTVFWAKTSR